MTWGIRPTAAVLGRDSRKPWGKWDILLAQAYQILEDERCPQCGLPVYVCGNESEDVQIQLLEVSCAVVAKKANHGGRGKSKKSLPEGTVLQPRPYHVNPDVDLVSLRAPYYKAQRKKREELDATLRPSVETSAA